MWIRTKKVEPFTARKINEIVGVSLYTVKAYITFLKRNGHLDTVGYKRTNTSKAPLYLIRSDKLQMTVPIMRRRSEIDQIEKKLDQVKELANNYYQAADTKTKTIKGLIAVTNQIEGKLLSCEKIALKLRSPGAKSA